MAPRVTILGVPIDAITMQDAVERMMAMPQSGGQHHIATPNNEMLVEAHRNPEFRRVLQNTAMNLPDSTGLLLAARRLGQQLPGRVPGIDAMQELCARLGSEHPVFLLGAAPGIAEAAAVALRQKNPRLTIAGTFSGSPHEVDAVSIRRRIVEAQPHVLFVAFGAPAQELWIAQHLKDLPSVHVAMGIGGAFDVIAGRITRAPKILRTSGLEWAWRLLLQPWRFKRIWNAAVLFPWLALTASRASVRSSPRTTAPPS